ncbi:glucoamylase family protein [Sphingomonas sp. CV7422]|uniref:glucoamylase family protein n=1 Tax=Sphingomonas sp. CV7422 TaxID=3018036 RepID=UPI0022FDF598|nr:glucoamylase family protein [Sphingomonas sp. CV7422]
MTFAPIDRRALLARAPLATAAACLPAAAGAAPARVVLPGWFDDLEERTFRFFWDLANRDNGLVPDRWPTPSFASIAAVGFALTAYPIGVARGWIRREEARDLTLATLRFFATAPQGDAPAGMSGHQGFFYHFLDMKTGTRFRDTELSSVDTTLLFLGILFAGAWYDAADPAEAEIRQLAQTITDRADWPWFTNARGNVSMGWHPGQGFIDRAWEGYNEGMMVYVVGLGSRGKPLADGAWEAWTKTYPAFWRGRGKTRHLAFAPLFGHQYSQMWIDFRGIRDAVMRRAGIDYFENSRRATYANRAYCIANPMRWDGYGRDIWGLTACDGPGNLTLPFKGRTATFFGYSARGPLGQPDGRDDGTLAPTAALGSLAFAPEIVVPCAEAMKARPRLYGQYGFLDSFNPSFRYTDARLEAGSVDSTSGWVDGDYLGIDQGAILGAIANTRDEGVWQVMRRSPTIRRGLQRAGFAGGWLG